MSVMLAGACRNALAQAIPPNPAPTMTTRGKPSRLKAGLPDSSGKPRPHRCANGAWERERPGTLGDKEKQDHRQIERAAHLTATHCVVAEHHDGKKGGCARGEPASNEEGQRDAGLS